MFFLSILVRRLQNNKDPAEIDCVRVKVVERQNQPKTDILATFARMQISQPGLYLFAICKQIWTCIEETLSYKELEFLNQLLMTRINNIKKF